MEYLWRAGAAERMGRLSYWGFSAGRRIGELDPALRILVSGESFWEGRDGRDAKYSLQRCYGSQAVILRAWGRLEEAMALHKKQEALCVELGNKSGLQASYGGQARILTDWGRLEEAMALFNKKEVLCLEVGDKDSLQRCYGYQASILRAWGRLEEAMALLQEEGAAVRGTG